MFAEGETLAVVGGSGAGIDLYEFDPGLDRPLRKSYGLTAGHEEIDSPELPRFRGQWWQDSLLFHGTHAGEHFVYGSRNVER